MKRVTVAQMGRVANLLAEDGWVELSRSLRLASQPAWTILRRRDAGVVQVVRVNGGFVDGRYRARARAVLVCADGCRRGIDLACAGWSAASFDEWDHAAVAGLVSRAVRESVVVHAEGCRFAA